MPSPAAVILLSLLSPKQALTLDMPLPVFASSCQFLNNGDTHRPPALACHLPPTTCHCILLKALGKIAPSDGSNTPESST